MYLAFFRSNSLIKEGYTYHETFLVSHESASTNREDCKIVRSPHPIIGMKCLILGLGLSNSPTRGSRSCPLDDSGSVGKIGPFHRRRPWVPLVVTTSWILHHPGDVCINPSRLRKDEEMSTLPPRVFESLKVPVSKFRRLNVSSLVHGVS